MRRAVALSAFQWVIICVAWWKAKRQCTLDHITSIAACQGERVRSEHTASAQLSTRSGTFDLAAVQATSSRAGTFSYNFDLLDQRISVIASTGSGVDAFDDSSVEQRALATASAFGSLIRRRRKELKIRQAQLALATGVGRRFLIELESGKPSCQLGRSLLVAEALGLKPADILGSETLADDVGPELPDLTEEAQDSDGQSPRLL